MRSSVKVLDFVRSGGLCDEEEEEEEGGFVFWFGGSESSSSSLDLDIVKDKEEIKILVIERDLEKVEERRERDL